MALLDVLGPLKVSRIEDVAGGIEISKAITRGYQRVVAFTCCDLDWLACLAACWERWP